MELREIRFSDDLVVMRDRETGASITAYEADRKAGELARIGEPRSVYYLTLTAHHQLLDDGKKPAARDVLANEYILPSSDLYRAAQHQALIEADQPYLDRLRLEIGAIKAGIAAVAVIAAIGAGCLLIR